MFADQPIDHQQRVGRVLATRIEFGKEFLADRHEPFDVFLRVHEKGGELDNVGEAEPFTSKCVRDFRRPGAFGPRSRLCQNETGAYEDYERDLTSIEGKLPLLFSVRGLNRGRSVLSGVLRIAPNPRASGHFAQLFRESRMFETCLASNCSRRDTAKLGILTSTTSSIVLGAGNGLTD